mmetsp:Transcript_7946/g.13174  ORF Transcript_7946/g.13174 Transcript_7946/m.13174 type:complete len:204 (+) Transcript_7946:1160-1771(+)
MYPAISAPSHTRSLPSAAPVMIRGTVADVELYMLAMTFTLAPLPGPPPPPAPTLDASSVPARLSFPPPTTLPASPPAPAPAPVWAAVLTLAPPRAPGWSQNTPQYVYTGGDAARVKTREGGCILAACRAALPLSTGGGAPPAPAASKLLDGAMPFMLLLGAFKAPKPIVLLLRNDIGNISQTLHVPSPEQVSKYRSLRVHLMS